jgi:hypothetical protein
MTRKRKATMSPNSPPTPPLISSSDDDLSDTDEKEHEEKVEYSNDDESQQDDDELTDEDDFEEARSTIYLTSDNEEYTESQINAIPSLQNSVDFSMTESQSFYDSFFGPVDLPLDASNDINEPLTYADQMIRDMLANVLQSSQMQVPQVDLMDRNILTNNENENETQRMQSTNAYLEAQNYLDTLLRNHSSSQPSVVEMEERTFTFTGSFSSFISSSASTGGTNHPISEPSMFVLSSAHPLMPPVVASLASDLPSFNLYNNESSLRSPSRRSQRYDFVPRISAPLRSMRARRRYFTRDATSIILVPRNLAITSFSTTDYELANEIFNHLLSEEEEYDYQYIPTVCVNVLNLILEFWYEHDKEQFPTYNQIIAQISREISRMVPLDFEAEDFHEIIHHYLSRYGYLPHPNELNNVYEYYVFNGEYPSETDLHEMNQRALAFYLNPELYHQQDKIKVPALHIDKIPRTKNTASGVDCCICQDEIKLDQLTIRLPPCNHVYHVNADDCLGDGSILNWLKENNTCPMCKQKVEVLL